MQRFVPIFCLLLLSFCHSSQETNRQDEPSLLQKFTDYHDPEENWQHFKARLYLIHTDTAGKKTLFPCFGLMAHYLNSLLILTF